MISLHLFLYISITQCVQLRLFLWVLNSQSLTLYRQVQTYPHQREEDNLDAHFEHDTLSTEISNPHRPLDLLRFVAW